MTSLRPAEMAVLSALSTARVAMPEADLVATLAAAGVAPAEARGALSALVRRGLAANERTFIHLTGAGAVALLDVCAAIEAALDPTAPPPGHEECPSVPWLTAVRTRWIDAISLNYAVEPGALAALLPAPLEPEIHKGSAWVQVLISSLRDMRPQGVPAIFGVCFYQVSYRAAVTCAAAAGGRRRGGYFVRSETNHPVMRAVGNALTEFKFHDFGAAEVVMLRDGERLTAGVEPGPGFPGGKIVAVIDTRPLAGPPPGSVWASLEEVHEPLVECYDAFGVDARAGFLYTLTIDREPWDARFVRPESLYCEYADVGSLGGGRSRLDSVLHVRECGYRWLPLRRAAL